MPHDATKSPSAVRCSTPRLYSVAALRLLGVVSPEDSHIQVLEQVKLLADTRRNDIENKAYHEIHFQAVACMTHQIIQFILASQLCL